LSIVPFLRRICVRCRYLSQPSIADPGGQSAAHIWLQTGIVKIVCDRQAESGKAGFPALSCL